MRSLQLHSQYNNMEGISVVTFKQDGSNKQAETFSPERPDPSLFPLLPFPRTISSRQLVVEQHTFTATGDGRCPKEKKKRQKKKNKTAGMPQNVQSACPARRVSCQRRQQMPEADSGMERLRAECRRCASRCCTLLPSSSRQEAGVQLQSILLNFKTSPPPPTPRPSRLAGRLAAGHSLFASLRHLSPSASVSSLRSHERQVYGKVGAWMIVCCRTSPPLGELATGLASLSWNRPPKLTGGRIYKIVFTACVRKY